MSEKQTSLLDLFRQSPIWGCGLEIEPRVVDSPNREVNFDCHKKSGGLDPKIPLVSSRRKFGIMR